MNELTMLIPGVHQLIQDDRFPYVSFFPFGGTVTGLTLTGFKYETTECDT